MELWGVTGLMGAGKSTAIAYLKKLGCPVADADQASRAVVDPASRGGPAAVGEIVKLFGASVLESGGKSLDRRVLRNRIAASPVERGALEKLLHPLIRKYLMSLVQTWESAGAERGFIEGSRIVESGFAASMKGCVLVTAPEGVRLTRVMNRDHMSAEETKRMFALQDETRLRAACRVEWVNDGVEPELFAQIEEFLKI